MSELLGALVAQKRAIEAEIKHVRDEHSGAMYAMGRRVDEIEGKIRLLSAEVDPDRVALALKVMEVGEYSWWGDKGHEALQNAMTQIAQRGGSLWREYICITNFYGRVDRLNRYYGASPPAHDVIVFRIGLRPETLARRSPDVAPALTDEEMDACIYYLLNVERIQHAAKGQPARSAIT